MKQLGIALHNYHDAFGSFPLGGVNLGTGADGWNGLASMLSWRALILPQLEQGTVYNSLNLSVTISSNGTDSGAGFTAWNTVAGVWICPSDGTNNGGKRPSNTADPNNGQYPSSNAPTDPSTGQPATIVPVANYAGSFGDNYAIAGLTATPNPWETPIGVTPVPGQTKIGWPGFWGTSFNADLSSDKGGTLRGFFDYRTGQVVNMAGVTDGTSNTILVGEMIPQQAADSNLYQENGASAGTTIPINWNSAGVPNIYPGCNVAEWGSAVWGCRFSYASKGFKSMHPGGANMLFADGSVHFLKNSIAPNLYAGLGSRNGGEVISADSF
jgi:prepilin-type processing-associated H-X9-DG protein